MKIFFIATFLLLHAACTKGGAGGTSSITNGNLYQGLEAFNLAEDGTETKFATFRYVGNNKYLAIPYVASGNIYELKFSSPDLSSYELNFDNIETSRVDDVLSLQGTRDSKRIRMTLVGDQSYAFKIDASFPNRPKLEIFVIDTVDSKEWKLLLNPRMFSNGLSDVESFRTELESVVKEALSEDAIFERFNGDDVDEIKETTFFDTRNTCYFDNANYSIRQRYYPADNNYEYTLKYRSREISESGKGLTVVADGLDWEDKFEIDIGTDSQSFSLSTDILSDTEIDLSSTNQLYANYTEFAINNENVIRPPLDMQLEPINTKAIYERAYELLGILFDDDEDNPIDRSLELALWYDDEFASSPDVAEISFKIKASGKVFSEEALDNAERIFQALAVKYDEKILASQSKTKTVYAKNPSFCNHGGL